MKLVGFCSSGDGLQAPRRDLFAPFLWFVTEILLEWKTKKRCGLDVSSVSRLDLSPSLFILLCISCVREVLKGIYHSAFHTETIINPRHFFLLCLLYGKAHWNFNSFFYRV